jgi:hypothetical protein
MRLTPEDILCTLAYHFLCAFFLFSTSGNVPPLFHCFDKFSLHLETTVHVKLIIPPILYDSYWETLQLGHTAPV